MLTRRRKGEKAKVCLGDRKGLLFDEGLSYNYGGVKTYSFGISVLVFQRRLKMIILGFSGEHTQKDLLFYYLK
jgi:hypothetical protein